MANDKLRIVAKRPHEAAKMFAMYLLHAGVLCEYSKGNKPIIITVSTASLFVNFKAWFSNRPPGTEEGKGLKSITFRFYFHEICTFLLLN